MKKHDDYVPQFKDEIKGTEEDELNISEADLERAKKLEGAVDEKFDLAKVKRDRAKKFWIAIISFILGSAFIRLLFYLISNRTAK